MTRVMKTSWTGEDLRLLREYAEKGYSAYRIAAALRRTVSGVKSMAAKKRVLILTGRDIRARIESGQISRVRV